MYLYYEVELMATGLKQFLFNSTTESFLKVVHSHLQEIIENETDLKILRRRIHLGHRKLPYELVVFDGTKLGYFCATTSRIAINKYLMYKNPSN